MRGVPEGWASTTLGEICTKPQYGWTTKASPQEGSIKLVRTTDITKGQIDWKTVPFCTEGPENEEKYLLRSGDIVISRAGSVGASMLLQDPIPRAVFASYLIRFRSRLGVDPRFVGFFLKSARYWAAVHGSASGIALPNVNAKKLAALDLPLAPFSEQHRIVAKIESLFAKLDEGVAALKRAEVNLERYRASVLKSAVEGRLTEQWRRENPAKETGEELLQRILTERRKRWEEEQFAKFTAKGRMPPKNWKTKYKEPVAPDTDTLPELPEGWCWATVDQVTASMANGIYKPAKFYSDNGIPCLRMYNIVDGELVLRDLKRMVLSEDELNRYGLKSGDLLINRVNSRELVGKAAAIPDGLGPIVFESKNIRLRPVGMGYETRFLGYCFAVLAPAYFGRHSQQVVGMASISQQQIGRLVVPVPPSSEQRRIVAAVDRRKRSSARLEDTIEAKRRRSRALRQSILKRAFEGGLVPQDSTDEPASALLQRIRAESKASSPARPRKRRRKLSKPGSGKGPSADAP